MSQAAARKARPKYLNLAEIRLPVNGWVSILHRISGVVLFVSTVWLIYLLDRSLASPEGFESVKRYVGFVPVKLSFLVLIWAFCHHFCAGLRYLLLDLDKGVDKETSQKTAIAVLVAGLVLTAIFGARLW